MGQRCSNCGYWPAKSNRKGRCGACYHYWWRTGSERPPEVIERHYWTRLLRKHYPRGR